MKIIDLLNKIANGEEVPKKIKYKDFEYIYAKEIGWYRRIDDVGTYDEWFINKNRLNDEVEIIEEQEEIDIQSIKELEPLEDYEVDKTDVRLNRELINKILQWAKQLDKKR
jgi:translation elongation factor P/translation initiation factor 5A